MALPLRDLKEYFPMSRLCMAGVGGVARYFCLIRDTDDLIELLRWCGDLSLPVQIIGTGANTLLPDEDFDGMLIRLATDHISFDGDEVYVDAGMPIVTFIEKCAEQNLGGLEDLSGVPGTIGGAIVGNAGAHRQSFSDRVIAVDVLTRDGEVKEMLPAKDFAFAYRHSDFKHRDEIILGARLKMLPGEFETLKERCLEVLHIKKATQPWTNTSGSYFKNPEGHSAWKLIDECGLRGYQIGGAQISEMHSNFFINAGDATRADFDALEQLCRDSVKAQFGIELEREVRKLGEDF